MPFLLGLPLILAEQAGVVKNAPDAGGAASDDVAVEHHEGEPAIAFEGIGDGEVDDAAFFLSRVSQWSRGIQALCSLTLP